MKARSQFVCQQCGATYNKWVGQCSNCGEGNSLVEQAVEDLAEKKLTIDKAKNSGKTSIIMTKRKNLKKPPDTYLGYVTYKNEIEIVI